MRHSDRDSQSIQAGDYHSLPDSRSGPANLEVFDVAGRLVKRLASGTHPAGDHQRTWHGRDNAGGMVASGVYIVRLKTSQRTISQRVTLLR